MLFRIKNEAINLSYVQHIQIERLSGLGYIAQLLIMLASPLGSSSIQCVRITDLSERPDDFFKRLDTFQKEMSFNFEVSSGGKVFINGGTDESTSY